MRFREFIQESAIPSENVVRWYESNGYTLIGKGDAAWVFKKGNTAYKVYGPGQLHTTKGIIPTDNDDQEMALRYYNFCKNENNPFLPKFKNYRYLDSEKTHLEIQCELLSPGGDLAQSIADLLQELMYTDGTLESFKENNPDSYQLISSKLTSKDIELLARTWSKIIDLGSQHDYSTHDMNGENIMFRGNTPVINDPWTLG